jgi:hypothetical protein
MFSQERRALPVAVASLAPQSRPFNCLIRQPPTARAYRYTLRFQQRLWRFVEGSPSLVGLLRPVLEHGMRTLHEEFPQVFVSTSAGICQLLLTSGGLRASGSNKASGFQNSMLPPPNGGWPFTLGS